MGKILKKFFNKCQAVDLYPVFMVSVVATMAFLCLRMLWKILVVYGVLDIAVVPLAFIAIFPITFLVFVALEPDSCSDEDEQ